VFAPFFGIPTASITATAKLAAFNGSPVMLVSNFRNLRSRSWDVYMGERLTDFPTGNDVTDAATINRTIEAEVIRHPEQYLWMHRRFKTRPEGQGSYYRKT
jgi:KDO2-lipid IV(A) lauroyltransferase